MGRPLHRSGWVAAIGVVVMAGCPSAPPVCDLDEPGCASNPAAVITCLRDRPNRFLAYLTGRFSVADGRPVAYEDYRSMAPRGLPLELDQPQAWNAPVTLVLIPDLGEADKPDVGLERFACRIDVLFIPPPGLEERVSLRLTSEGGCELVEERAAGEQPPGGWVLYISGSWPVSSARRGVGTGTVGLEAGLDSRLILAALEGNDLRAINAQHHAAGPPQLTLTPQNGVVQTAVFSASQTYRDIATAGSAAQIGVELDIRAPQAGDNIVNLEVQLNRFAELAGLPRLP